VQLPLAARLKPGAMPPTPLQASHGVARKFLSVVELLLAPALAPRGAAVLTGGSLRASLAAMAAHRSQWVW
jgi:hypothetical protein